MSDLMIFLCGSASTGLAFLLWLAWRREDRAVQDIDAAQFEARYSRRAHLADESQRQRRADMIDRMARSTEDDLKIARNVH